MLTPSKKCKVCLTIEKKPELEKDIDNSSWYIKTSSRTLLAIQKDYMQDFAYDSRRAHVKRHQFLTAKQIANKTTKAIAKQHQAKQKFRDVKANVVWDNVITTGLQKLQDGELELRATDLLKAVKDKSDYELKVKDQELQMAEMVAFFASGEGSLEESRKYDRRVIEGETVTDYDPTLEPTTDTDRRQAQSRSFYQSLVGDAATSGAD